MSEDKNKDVKRETLANYRITYEENPRTPQPAFLPKRVGVLREGLLSFKGRLVKEHTSPLREEEAKSIPHEDSPYMIRGDDDLEIVQKLKTQTELAVIISRRAASLKADHRQEKRWESLLFNTVFKHLEDAECPARESNHRWNEDLDIPKAAPSDIYLTEPKPDIYLGFPIKNSSYQELDGFWKDHSNENFSIGVLGKLLNEGLVCTPTTGVRKYLDRKAQQKVHEQSRGIFTRVESNGQQGIDSEVKDEPKFSKDHLLCFPWAIVELKHEGVSKSEVIRCHCQGANAASKALWILENLSRYAETAEGGQHVPPVVVLTFIGPNFKLWIAFSTLDADGVTNYKMICIEERSIDTFWGALRLCHIVDDMSFWATRILKPQISMYIDQWRSRHMNGLRRQIAQDSRLSAFVRKIEQCERDLGLPRSTNLAETIRLAMVLSEVSSMQDKELSKPSKQSPAFQMLSSDQSTKLPVRASAIEPGNIARNTAAIPFPQLEAPPSSGLPKSRSHEDLTGKGHSRPFINEKPADTTKGTSDGARLLSEFWETLSTINQTRDRSSRV